MNLMPTNSFRMKKWPPASSEVSASNPLLIRRILLVALLVCAQPSLAKWIKMPPVPVDRLITNTESVLTQHPNNPEAYYLLGRLYSMKFSLRTEAGALVKQGQVPTLDALTNEHETRASDQRFAKGDIENANRSLANYKRAVELAPNSTLDHFGLAWMEQECSRFAGELGQLTASELLAAALSEYRTAYQLALPNDQNSQSHLRPYLAVEAGNALIELLKEHPGNEAEILRIEGTIRGLQGHSRAITPIIFSLNPDVDFAALLSTGAVSFDLDGFKDGRRWPWVRSDTCILVWDPGHAGQITSGRQLFGSVSWWLFWNNGFEALAALDDNHDGVLTGAELRGIAVWRDSNSNGIADPGEVVSAEGLGISSIEVRPVQADRYLFVTNGIALRNGTLLKTFDWMPESLPVQAATAK